MLSEPNWQSRVKKEGDKCFVPIRRLDNGTTYGRIGQTQVSTPGTQVERVRFIRSQLKRYSGNHFLRMGLLKRSIVGASMVTKLVPQDDANSRIRSLEYNKVYHRGQFYLQAKRCGEREPSMMGTNVIIGPDHTHRSFTDQGDKKERNGRYKKQKPIPASHMIDGTGQLVPWEAGPLSDDRSNGDWVINFDRFYVGDPGDTEEGQMPDRLIVNKVGHYYYRI